MKTNGILLILLMWGACRDLLAQGQIVDQTFTPLAPFCGCNFYETIDAEGGDLLLGQEFTPCLSSLDFVDLYVYNDRPGLTTAWFPLFVEIHSDTIDGPLLGTSSTLFYGPHAPGGLAHLTFPTPITLSPRDRYVIRPFANGGVMTSDRLLIGVVQPAFGTYTGGRFLYALFGGPQENRDMWFREGITVQPGPALQVIPSPTAMAVRWPTSATNFVLEATAALSSGSQWEAVTNQVETVDGMFSVTVDYELPARFFRLRKPL